MSTIIKYDGLNPFQGHPTPFVTKSQEVIHYGKRWGQTTRLELKGQVYGDYEGIIAAQNQIFSRLTARQFKTFQIEEDLSVIFSLSNCKVESVNFTESKMAVSQEYSISIVGYESSLFSGVFGITDPQESFNFSDGGDGTVSMSHSISAKGFNTTSLSSNAFTNAKNYVLSLTGWNNQITPSFANAGLTPYPVLLSQTEKIDRLAANYSIEESYIFNHSGISLQPITNISVSTENGIENDFTTVNLSVDLKGGRTFSSATLRNYATGLNLHSLAETHSSINNLDTNPVSYSVNEDSLANTISIKAVFDNNELFSGQSAYFDYSVSFETDEITKITTANLQGDIIGRGHMPYKLSNAESFLNSTILPNMASYLSSTVSQIYSTLGLPYSISTNAKSLSIDKNPFNGNINISASYSDVKLIQDDDAFMKFRDLNYEVKIKPSLQTFKPFKSLNQNGYYLIYDMNSRNREKIDFSIAGSHVNLYFSSYGVANLDEHLNNSSDQAKSYIYTLLDNLKNVYLLGANQRIEAESLNVDLDGGKISANYGFSQEQQHPTFTDSESKIAR